MFIQEENVTKLLPESAKNISDRLNAGLYEYSEIRTMFGIKREFKVNTRYKNAHKPKGGVFAEAVELFDGFFDEDVKKIMKDLKMTAKINVIFNGKPGTGKTHLASVIAEEYVQNNDAIGIIVDDIEDINFGELVDYIRQDDDPDRLIIFILDELEKNRNSDLKNSKFLGFLDGPSSKDNVIVIATTNDISEFPDYLRNRKGRFEKIFNFEFAKSPELIESAALGLYPQLENNSEMLDVVVKSAINLGIETIDDLRFHILDLLKSNLKNGVLPTIPEKVEEKLDDESAREEAKNLVSEVKTTLESYRDKDSDTFEAFKSILNSIN